MFVLLMGAALAGTGRPPHVSPLTIDADRVLTTTPGGVTYGAITVTNNLDATMKISLESSSDQLRLYGACPLSSHDDTTVGTATCDYQLDAGTSWTVFVIFSPSLDMASDIMTSVEVSSYRVNPDGVSFSTRPSESQPVYLIASVGKGLEPGKLPQ